MPVIVAAPVLSVPVLWVCTGASDQAASEPLYCVCRRIDKQQVADATVRGGLARFINHCCDPNCKPKEFYGPDGVARMGIYALRDIQPGEELHYDYQVRHTAQQPVEALLGVTATVLHYSARQGVSWQTYGFLLTGCAHSQFTSCRLVAPAGVCDGLLSYQCSCAAYAAAAAAVHL